MTKKAEIDRMRTEKAATAEIQPGLYAVSKIFAEARKQMTLSEYKVFAYAMSQVSWKEPCPGTLVLNKKAVAKVAGVESDYDHLSENLNRSIGKMPKNSFVSFADKDRVFYLNGCFITAIAFGRNTITIRFLDYYLPLFGSLDRNYITLWSGDIFKMRSLRSVAFYEQLRLRSDTRLAINKETFSTKELKELFGIPERGRGSYVDAKTGCFN